MVVEGCRKRVPPSASIWPAAILRSVDLPEPFRPTRQRRSPALTDSSTPLEQRRAAEGQADVVKEEKRRHRPLSHGGVALVVLDVREGHLRGARPIS